MYSIYLSINIFILFSRSYNVSVRVLKWDESCSWIKLIHSFHTNNALKLLKKDSPTVLNEDEWRYRYIHTRLALQAWPGQTRTVSMELARRSHVPFRTDSHQRLKLKK